MTRLSPNRRFPSCRLAASIVLAGGALGHAVGHAAPPAAHAASGATTGAAASAPLLTQAKLRECLSRRDQLQADSTDIAAQKVALDKDRDELQAGIAAMQERAATVDRKKQADVDAYNADSNERNRQVGVMGERITAFNAKATALLDAQDAFNKDCVNKPYDPRDAVDKPH